MRSIPTLLLATLLAAGIATAQEPAPAQNPAPAQAQTPAQAQAPAPTEVAAATQPTVVSVAGLPIQLYGSMWVDTGYLDRNNTQPSEPDEQVEYMTGRFVLGGTYRRQVGGVTASATVELLALVHEYRDSSYEPHAQDVYVMLAGKTWDVRVGRFLGIEAYYRGQGIELYTAEEAGAKNAPALYYVNLARGQLNGPGQVAARFRPLDNVTLELGSVYGFTSNQNVLAVRPVLDANWGGLRVVGGYEYIQQDALKAGDKAKLTNKGWGGRVQYSLVGVTAGVDYARLSTEATQIDGLTDAALTLDKTSMGGFVDADFWKLSLGLGYHLTTQKNDKGEENWHKQAFASLLYRLPFDGLSVKGVYGFARGKIEDIDSHSEFENDLGSFRVRILYEFR